MDHALKSIHALFDRWLADERLISPLLIHRARLVVHEWLANLARHADFYDRKPNLLMRFFSSGTRLHCVIEDNSQGFDFDRHRTDADTFDLLPDGGMGLQIIRACTSELTYTHLHPSRHRLEIVVADEGRHG